MDTAPSRTAVVSTPPLARVEVVRDTYFGVTVEDPYRWLEEWQSPEARSWLDAQSAYARRALDALPERAVLVERLNQLAGAVPELFDLRLAGGRAFYLRREPDIELARLVVRVRPDASERVLVDPNTMAGDGPLSIDWYVPAPDGRRVAYGIAQGGSEATTLYVLDVETGEQLVDAISRVHFPFIGWLEDGRSFVYHRYPDPPPGTPPAERRFDTCSYVHRLGDDPDQDRPVFGRGLNPQVEMTRFDRPFIIIPPGSRWMIGVISHSALGLGNWSDCTFFAAPRDGLDDPATCPWRKLAAVDDGVLNFAVDGDTVYLVTRRDAPRYRVLAVSLERPDFAAGAVVVPESRAVLEDVRVVGGELVTRELDGGVSVLRRVQLAGGRAVGSPRRVELPISGTIAEWTAEPGGTTLLLRTAGWTMSERVYHYDASTQASEDTGWIPPSPVDFSDIEAHEVEARAADGTLIPLSIIQRKGLVRDGNNPTLLTGYGAYGFPALAHFRPDMRAWYERGGVWAVAHIRGGGEFGRAWHEAGRLLQKENTIGDFIACAEHLIREGYTRPGRLAGEGGSAGGIPTGGALVRRPELWAAMVMHVAVTNALRSEQGENGPVNVPEFGSVATEDGFRALLIADSYQRVQHGVAYPAVLLTAGLNDPRVNVWQATKMAARLQAATTSGRPVLLRVEEQGGHGVTTQSQLIGLLADEFAFLFEQLKV